MKNISILIFSSTMVFMSCVGQQKKADEQESILKQESPIEFNYKYKDKYHDTVELIVFNKSDKMKFFSIGVAGLTDKGNRVGSDEKVMGKIGGNGLNVFDFFPSQRLPQRGRCGEISTAAFAIP